MRVVAMAILLATVTVGSTAAHAKRHRRHPVSLRSNARSVDRNRPPKSLLDAKPAPKPAPANPPPSFVELHTARVKNDLMMFHPDFPGLDPALPREIDRAADTTEAPLSFVTPPRTDDLLELTRRRDRLLLFRQEHRSGEGTALGLAVFGAMTVLAAHMPPPLRVLFDDRRIHLGPAIFDDGGMGAGLAGAIP
jgi:hypothetical protein